MEKCLKCKKRKASLLVIFGDYLLAYAPMCLKCYEKLTMGRGILRDFWR